MELNEDLWAHRIPETDWNSDRSVANYWTAMAHAYLEKYGEHLLAPGSRDASGEQHRQWVAHYFYPAVAAFTAAATLRGWSTRSIKNAVEDGQTMAEFLFQWLSEAGLTDGQIDALEVYA